MLNVDTIKNGLVIDHIKAGSGWRIFNRLGLDRAPYSAALIMNVPSKKSQKKDIIKIDNIINFDYSVLGCIDPNITINVIADEKIVRKIKLEFPALIKDVFRCKNPRCITQSESYASARFILVDKAVGLYRCRYCDALYSAAEGNLW